MRWPDLKIETCERVRTAMIPASKPAARVFWAWADAVVAPQVAPWVVWDMVLRVAVEAELGKEKLVVVVVAAVAGSSSLLARHIQILAASHSSDTGPAGLVVRTLRTHRAPAAHTRPFAAHHHCSSSPRHPHPASPVLNPC
jgi:hypothetical protein